MNKEQYSLIDTHTHLYFEQFEQDIDQVIQRARQAGLKAMITVGINLDTSRKCIDLAEMYPDVFAAVGVHPNDSTKFEDSTIEQLKKLSQHPKVVAIGEIGLDYYRDWAPVETQHEAFRKQIRLAKEIGLPIIIHNREALADILKILKNEGTKGLQGVFHCFSNNREWAQQVLDLGFFVSFTGNVTFKKSDLPDVARAVPMERLLLETDSPFLSPQPRRGRRNEPAHIVFIAEKLAEIKGLELSQLARATTTNAIRLFGLSNEIVA